MCVCPAQDDWPECLDNNELDDWSLINAVETCEREYTTQHQWPESLDEIDDESLVTAAEAYERQLNSNEDETADQHDRGI